MPSLPENDRFIARGEREEYRLLSQMETDLNTYMVQEAIEYLFEKTPTKGGYWGDSDGSLRQTVLDGRQQAIEPDEPVLLFNTKKKRFMTRYFMSRPSRLRAELRHMDFHDNPEVKEEYAVKIEHHAVGADRPFVTFYSFVNSGDTWEARVEARDIDPSLSERGIARYSRTMTAYDFDAFFRDIDDVAQSYVGEEVHAHVPGSAV